jgi:hypothetical protein
MLSIVRICSFLQTKRMLCCILSLVTSQLHTDSLTQHLRDVRGQIHAVHLLYVTARETAHVYDSEKVWKPICTQRRTKLFLLLLWIKSAVQLEASHSMDGKFKMKSKLYNYAGQYGGKPPIFSSEIIITVTMRFTYIMSTFFMKLRLFFHKVFFTFNTLFHLCMKCCMQSRKTPCWSIGALHTCCITVPCPQNSILGVRPSGGPKSWKFEGAESGV